MKKHHKGRLFVDLQAESGSPRNPRRSNTSQDFKDSKHHFRRPHSFSHTPHYLSTTYHTPPNASPRFQEQPILSGSVPSLSCHPTTDIHSVSKYFGKEEEEEEEIVVITKQLSEVDEERRRIQSELAELKQQRDQWQVRSEQMRMEMTHLQQCCENQASQLRTAEEDLNALLEAIEKSPNGILRTVLEETRRTNNRRAVWIIEKYLLTQAISRRESPWIAEQWKEREFTQFERGSSLLQNLQIEERLGRRTHPYPVGSQWYGSNAAVYSARPNAGSSNIPPSHKLCVRMIYGYVGGPGATSNLEQRFNDILSFCNLRSGKFVPHSNVLPVLHHWIERNVRFRALRDFDADLGVIGTHAAMSLSPQCSCNLEQLLSRRASPLDELEVIHVGRSVASGLNHLFNNLIVHRDLKLDNILLYWWDRERDLEGDELQHLILSRVLQSIPVVHDLDDHLWFAEYPQYAQEMKIPISPGISRGGAHSHLSPEVLAAKPSDGYISYLKDDAWALGVVLYQILHHPNHKTSFPYPDEEWSNRALSDLPTIPPLSPDIFLGHHSLGLKQLVCDLLRPDPSQRLSLADALQRFDAIQQNIMKLYSSHAMSHEINRPPISSS